MAANRKLLCPWPGPKPYKEEEADRFFGRYQEVEKLLDFIRQQRLTILTARSGVGKSSLLQAGLIPALRRRRELTGGMGPTLFVSEWGLLKHGAPADLISLGIRRDIERLAAWKRAKGKRLKEDVLRLSEVSPPEIGPKTKGERARIGLLIDYVRKLCGTTGGMVLIIDQAEELLGSGLDSSDQGVEREVFEVVGALFRGEPKLRVLLSLREEYHGRLVPLARHVDSVERRLFRLDPMPRETVRTVLESIATKGSLLGDREIDTILSWLGISGGRSEDSDRPVDLLRLQVLLVSLFRFAKGSLVFSEGRWRIPEDVLADFRNGREPKELARVAMEEHINGLFDRRHFQEPPIGLGRGGVRRVAARMAPWLSSSGGFKRPVTSEELLYNSLREEFDVLGIAGESGPLQEKLRDFVDADDLRGLDLICDEVSVGNRVVYLSGNARVHGWDLTRTARMLVDAGVEAIDLFCKERVLKATRGSGLVTYELVHDGFGPALSDWAEKERRGLRDTINAITSRRGETFHWKVVEKIKLQMMSWYGCSINEVIFRDVVFDRCILNGSIFTDCTFESCSFLDCDLDGAVFRNSGSKEISVWSDVIWRESAGRSVLFFGLEWRNVKFSDCILDGITVERIVARGGVKFIDDRIRFAQIFRFQGLEEKVVFLDCDLTNSLYENPSRRILQCEGVNILWAASEGDIPRVGSRSTPSKIESA